ncbi:hypothetical protein MCAMS1_02824 [biofilm metagenome]
MANLNVRVSDDKKAALDEIVKSHRLKNISDAVNQALDKFISECGVEMALISDDKDDDDVLDSRNYKNLQFYPLPGDDVFLFKFAAARKMKPGTVLKLVLRGWAREKPVMPIGVIEELGLLSNRINAIGRNLNQLVRLAHSGVFPEASVMLPLLEEIKESVQQARKCVSAVIQENIKEWENDYA